MDEGDQPEPEAKADPEPIQEESQSNISPPPAQSQTSFNKHMVKSPQKLNYSQIERIVTCLRENDALIRKKIELIESLDISVSVVTYKIYDATHDFKSKINEIKEQRNKLLTSIENKSELSLILHDLDKKISDLNTELQDKINNYNQQKIAFQEQTEEIINQLDENVAKMQQLLTDLKQIFGFDQADDFRSQISFINEKYISMIKGFENGLLHYQQLQMTSWRVERSEEKLADLLEEQGLKFTPSGQLLTRTGTCITFEEAQQRGYLKEIDASLHKIFEFFKEEERDRDAVQEPTVLPEPDVISATGSLESKMCSEDVTYLKHHVGKPLTLALAEILAKQPRDPIHYLGHYLFKYRYNQELEMVQKKELDELTKERAITAERIWKKFIEDEARAAVIDMVLRSEEIAYQNELRRIAEEQMRAAQEEEYEEDLALQDEARDKFE